jgi:aryl-alcohol dehydrogenase-like predicted oxidoreductase/ferredoxin
MRCQLLGRTGLLFSRLGFGTLTFSRMQKNLSPDVCRHLLSFAASCGVNWLDTAEYYENYDLLTPFLDSEGQDTAVITKTYAYDAKTAQAALENARTALNRDVIDVFLLHEQMNEKTLSGHRGAFEVFLGAKAAGKIRAAGVSTHATNVVQLLSAIKAGTYRPDPVFPVDVYRHADVVFPLLSYTGIGLVDGTAREMEEASAACAAAGIGVLGMKLFGGGHLLSDREKAVRHALQLDFVAAWAVGMADESEIVTNAAWLSGEEPDEKALMRSAALPRRLMVESHCTGCGRCVARCRSKAMTIENGRAVCDPSRCTLCGYCAGVCPDFAIKVI